MTNQISLVSYLFLQYFHLYPLYLWYSDCSIIRLDRLEYHIREELNKTASRAMVVLHPLKVLSLV